MILHILHSAADNALSACCNLQLPAGHLPGIELKHPAHHEMPRTGRLLLQQQQQQAHYIDKAQTMLRNSNFLHKLVTRATP